MYCIVGNICDRDNLFSLNQKVWLVDGTGGEGWYKFVWLGRHRRKNRYIKKWMPTERVNNFRPAWVPEHIKSYSGFFDVEVGFYISGTREEMVEVAKKLNEFADNLRLSKAQPNKSLNAELPTGAQRFPLPAG